MRLDGRLEDFALPDVLQLLASTRKTGALLLDGAAPSQPARQGVIRLGAGAVDGASSDRGRQSLARRLVGSGIVGDEALERAAEDVRRGAPSLVRALLDRAGLAPSAVAGAAAEHTTDAVCELLRWEAGGFSFLVGEPDPDGLALGLPTGDLVAEGERRRQAWTTLTTHIPSPDTVLRLAPAPDVDPQCTREEWGLVALVDGSRTVAEIVALLGRSEFAVAGALAALVERGLLTVSDDSSGLAELQRRQAVISALESPEVPAEPAPLAAPAPMPAPTLEPTPAPMPAAVPMAAVPVARAAGSAPDAALLPGAAAAPPSAPSTHGSLALGPERAPEAAGQPRPQPSIGGLDSAVTKSLVLRLIAGVREL